MRTIGLSVLALALCILPACSPNSDTASDTAGSERPRIALIMKSLSNEFFHTMEDGARKHQEAHAAEYELIAQGIKDELDVARQIQLVEQMISQGVDAIVIAPADSQALVSVSKKAADAGIVVINIDNKFDDAVLTEQAFDVPFVGPDNRKGAAMVAAHLATLLKPGDPVAIIEGVPNAFNGVQRKLGFEDAMNAAGMKIVASQSGSWEMAQANQVVSALITEHPELKAVLCANDSMALGAVSALRAAGKLDDVKVIGYDGISAVEDLVKTGEIAATAEQHADQLAVFGIEHALAVLRGETAEDRETPVDLVATTSPTSR